MDSNGARFQLLLGFDDWAACTDADGRPLRPFLQPPLGHDPTAPGLFWDDTRNELILRPELFRFPAPAGSASLTPGDRRGAGRDRRGNWYWIDATRSAIVARGAAAATTGTYWSVGDGTTCARADGDGFRSCDPRPAPAALALSGLAVTTTDYLVAGVLSPAGLLVFDLRTTHPPRFLRWPAAVAFAPFDMAPSPGGGVWILDRDNKRYWALNRYFHVVRQDQDQATLVPERRADFQPTTGPERRWPARTFPGGIDISAAASLTGLDPIAIEGLPDGTVLILDNKDDRAVVSRYCFGQLLGQPVTPDLPITSDGGTFALIPHDFAFVPEHADAGAPGGAVPDRLFIVGTDGNQALPFNAYQQDDQLHLDAPADSSYYPLRLFAGKGLVTADTDAFYDFGDIWLPIRAQRRPRYATSGTLLTPLDPSGTGQARGAWDGRDPGCVWHRLTIDACVPDGTSLQVWSQAADDQRDLATPSWQQEPAPYRRGDGSEQPYVRLDAAGYGTWELLFQRARGRYLQLKIVLIGNGRCTPRVRAVRAYYPRFSYLERYLPAAYREDAPSASFLGRFLANVEGSLTALEDKIAAVQVLFDPRSAPSDALDWLATWFGVALDPAWDDGRRRLFLRHALDFFRFRGTVCGLEMALRLAFDSCPDDTIFTDCLSGAGPAYSVRFVEKFRTRGTSGALNGAGTDGGVLRPLTPGTRWAIGEGRAGLNRRYRDFPRPTTAPPPSAEYPLRAPDGDAATWRSFSQTVLGFVPSAGPSDLPRWQAFLGRRYRNAAALQAAYPGATRPADVPLPTRPPPDGSPPHLPPDGPPLVDWYQFESVVLATARLAHRFTVLLPAPPDDMPDRAAQARQLQWATRVVGLEKPAHTAFDVQFYWAMFRLGQARLGQDTLLDRAGRDLQSRRPIILDRSYLAEGFLTPPPGEAGRYVLGCGPLGSGSIGGVTA